MIEDSLQSKMGYNETRSKTNPGLTMNRHDRRYSTRLNRRCQKLLKDSEIFEIFFLIGSTAEDFIEIAESVDFIPKIDLGRL